MYGSVRGAISDGRPYRDNYHWCANETCLETDLTPSALFHQTNLTLPPLDPQSWILLIPIVSHVSECSTIRKAFALSVGVGITIAHDPLHGSGRAAFPHPALALGNSAHAA